METYELQSKWRYKVFHDLFVELAIDGFVSAENAYIELNQQENEQPNGRTYELFAEIRKGCIEAICFSAIAIESYINTFSASYISESFAETIDHLDPVAKWIVTMQVGKGIELKKGEAPVQRIAQCVKRRNAFVHSKSKPLSMCQDCGHMHIPEMNLLEDYIKPAYESLKALEDASLWVEKNWEQGTLNIDITNMHKKVKSKFKTVENTWIFREPAVVF